MVMTIEEQSVVDPATEPRTTGILALQHLRYLLAHEIICSPWGVEANQLQPNSVDLRLAERAYRVRCSFLPGDLGVEKCLEVFENKVHEFDLKQGAVLEPNVPYLMELKEQLCLPDNLSARANPKSSTGRLDIFARVVAETGEAFDEIPSGYHGRLFLHVISRSFPIRIRTGDRLVQLRVECGQARLSDEETRELQQKSSLLVGVERPTIDDGLHFSASLTEEIGARVMGYRARAHTPLLDLAGIGTHTIDDFWERLQPREEGALVLEPEAFYVMASHERVVVPASVCAEMVPFDAKSGELRTHYAGFFDSGFGCEDGAGARVVLEIRNRDTPFLLRDRQRIFRFQLYWNLAVPDRLYGQGVGSHYQGQGLRLAKQFRWVEEELGKR
jgi:dCTP deaminase